MVTPTERYDNLGEGKIIYESNFDGEKVYVD